MGGDQPLRGHSPDLALTILALDSGRARAILICGLLATGAAAGLAALMPRGRPSLAFRIASAWRALRPALASSTSDPLLAVPRAVIGNLSFTAGASGTYQYLCPVPGHAQKGMVGTLIVS